jgi:hypothetical protein
MQRFYIDLFPWMRLVEQREALREDAFVAGGVGEQFDFEFLSLSGADGDGSAAGSGERSGRGWTDSQITSRRFCRAALRRASLALAWVESAAQARLFGHATNLPNFA